MSDKDFFFPNLGRMENFWERDFYDSIVILNIFIYPEMYGKGFFSLQI